MRKGLISGLLIGGLLAAGGLYGSAWAVQPDEMLKDPQMEHRAREISHDLRCLVCQNQSIDDSDADLARDLRLLVRQRLTAGDSDSQVKQFLVDRYGDYVLLNPPFKATTLVLWLGPLVLFLAAVVAAVRFYRNRDTAQPTATTGQPLSDEEKRRLTALLGSGAEDSKQ